MADAIKRKRDETSSCSSLDTSHDTSGGEIKLSKSQNKKKAKKEKKDKELTLIIETEKPKPQKIKTMNIEQNLADINKKLSNVLTKEDHSFIKDIIKETIIELRDTILATVVKQVEVVEGALYEQGVENEKLKKEVNDLKQKMKEKENKTENLKRDFNKEVNEEKVRVNGKFNDQEQYGRRNNIRITQIPGDRKDEFSVETTHKVIAILNENLDMNLTPQNIDIAHRLGPYKYGRNRRVIVRFVHRQVAHVVLSKRKRLRGKGMSIFEDLTHINSEVLASTRKKRPDDVDQSWVSNGKIFVKWKLDGKIEQLEFKQFQGWLDLDWPENSNSSA